MTDFRWKITAFMGADVKKIIMYKIHKEPINALILKFYTIFQKEKPHSNWILQWILWKNEIFGHYEFLNAILYLYFLISETLDL